jgi:hypothetical protein
MLIHVDYKFAALAAVFAPRGGGPAPPVRGRFHLHLHLLLHQQMVLLLLVVLVLVVLVVLLHHPFSSTSSASYTLFPFAVSRKERKIGKFLTLSSKVADPGCSSRIPDLNFSIPDPGQNDPGSRSASQNLSIFNQKNCSRKNDLGCSSRIRIQLFSIPDPGVKKVPDPGSRSATLPLSSVTDPDKDPHY